MKIILYVLVLQVSACFLGTVNLFEIDSFDSVVVVIDGYCFLGSQRVDVKFVYEMFLKDGSSSLTTLNGSFNVLIYNEK